MEKKMTYEELCLSVDAAWSLFFSQLGFDGIDTEKVYAALDSKDCYNDVFGAVKSCVIIRQEE